MSAKRWPNVGDIVEVKQGKDWLYAEVIAESSTIHPDNPQYELEDVVERRGSKDVVVGQQLILTHTIKSYREYHATVRFEDGSTTELRYHNNKTHPDNPDWKHSKKKSLTT